MIIRSMQLEDLKWVLPIEKSLFTPGWKEESFRYELEENPFSYLYVLVDGQEIIGYVGFWVLFEQAQITTLAIRKNDQNQGLGEQLLQFALEKIKSQQCEMVTLEVRKSNLKAQKLYEKLGFNYIGERVNYYGNEDALMMGVGI